MNFMIFIDFPRNKNLIQISKIKNYLHKTAEMLIPQKISTEANFSLSNLFTTKIENILVHLSSTHVNKYLYKLA